MDLLTKIKAGYIPKHIAIIMDGNGRWAKKQGVLNRIFGHTNAIDAVRQATEGCAELGVQYLTLYAFSTENWNRPKAEVDALMELLVNTIKKETPTLHKNQVRLNTIGDFNALPKSCQSSLKEIIEFTKDNKGLTLTLALSYGGRDEIVKACQKIAQAVKNNELTIEQITETNFSNYLFDPTLPDPELMIRTSGEYRISNFLIWQLAYAELYITETLWPDFNKSTLHSAIADFQNRERRFGLTSEQLTQKSNA